LHLLFCDSSGRRISTCPSASRFVRGGNRNWT
jgi:hypothetical protein